MSYGGFVLKHALFSYIGWILSEFLFQSEKNKYQLMYTLYLYN